MKAKLLVLTLLTPFVMVTCGKRIPEPAGVNRGVPHLSWVIMHGDRDNPDQEFTCQSEPRNECEMPASQSDSQVFSDIHFYYHGAGPQTTFTGTVNLGFLEGTSNAVPVKAVARKSEAIAHQTIYGRVSSKPGTYEIAIDVVGSVAEAGTTQPIREKIPIVLR